MDPASIRPPDRRRFRRVEPDLPAVVRLVGAEHAATVRSISRTGAMVEIGGAVATPANGWVVLATPDNALRACDARVIGIEGACWRLAFDPTLPAMDLLGVAQRLMR